MGTAQSFVLRRQFYVGVSLLMGLMAIAGFWATYFGPLMRGASEHPALIHVHAAVFVGWLVLFLVQATLAATGRVVWHLRVGSVGLWYGVLLIGVGLYTGVVRSADRVMAGLNAPGLMWAAFADMVFFSTFFAAAAYFRRKHQIHKRLMVVAATALLIAAVARFPFLPASPFAVHVRALMWAAPILLAIGYDLKNRQAVHPAYTIGLVFLAARNYSGPVAQTDAWRAVTAWATSFVL